MSQLATTMPGSGPPQALALAAPVHKRLLLLHALFALLMLMLGTLARAQDFVAVPALQARVTDQAGMLRPDERSKLEAVLKEHEERTGNQIAVLLVKSTAPEAIEQYSIRVTDAWKLGRKGIDDGVLLLVAPDNPPALRRLRIEAGRGVQGSLTDAQSKRILQDVIAPHFRQNDFYGGLSAGVSAIASVVDREQLPANQKKHAAVDEDSLAGWLPFLLFAFIAIMTIRSRMRRGRRGFSSDGWGRSAGVILGSGIGWGTRGGLGGSGGFMGGGGFSGGGGGFSGGGGSFDGGGASGNW